MTTVINATPRSNFFFYRNKNERLPHKIRMYLCLSVSSYSLSPFRMSKPSTATLSKTPSQLSSKSAWAKGPPQTNSSSPTPRSQSPAPSNASHTPAHLTHSRRASNLGQGIPIKDSVSVPRANVGPAKPGPYLILSSNFLSFLTILHLIVAFGTIDDLSAHAPVAPPPAKPDGQNPSNSTSATSGHVNGRPSISASIKPVMTVPPATTASAPAASAKHKLDISKMFQGPSGPPSDSASPSVRPSNLPSQQPHQQPSQQQQQQQQQPAPPSSQPSQSQLSAHYTPFIPGGGGLRPQPQSGPSVGPGPVPRSPVYPRPMTNGAGPRPSGGQGPGGAPPPMSAGLSSPRLSSHPHPGPPNAMPLPQQMPWPYPYVRTHTRLALEC